MTGLVEMRSYGYPVVFDATHAVQKTPEDKVLRPEVTAKWFLTLCGQHWQLVSMLFLQRYTPIQIMLSADGPNQIHLSNIREILIQAIAIDNVTKQLTVRQ